MTTAPTVSGTRPEPFTAPVCTSTTTAVLLAAGPPAPDVTQLFGRASSAMMPVNGRPTVHWSLSYLVERGIRRVILGIRPDDSRLQRFVEQAFRKLLTLEFVPISQDRGPGYTLLECASRLMPEESCLVVLGDTIFEFPDLTTEALARSFVLVAPADDPSRWCLADCDASGLVRALRDKPAAAPASWPALIGVYHLSPIGPAVDALRETASTTAASLQLTSALQPYIAQDALHAHPAARWHDCGHVDRLLSSRRHLLQSRSFNRVEIDDVRGTITKHSEDTEKFLNEINYYRLLPADVAIFFPRLVDFSIHPSNTYLTLEYYGYPTLSELWTFEEAAPRLWREVFCSLSEILDCLSEYRAPLAPEALEEFFWEKTVQRVERFARSSPLGRELVGSDSIRLNGTTLEGWPRLRDGLRSAIRDLGAHPQGQIIHGDLCFPNILFDPSSHLFKLIDPRGSFVTAGIYGDVRYDVAKLLHSIDGGYDFLIHDMFSLSYEHGAISLAQFFPAHRPEVLASFEECLAGRFSMKELSLIEGLLFLSMCPLHADRPQRQTAMFGIGLRLLNEAVNA